jgi:hypothetical protein
MLDGKPSGDGGYSSTPASAPNSFSAVPATAAPQEVVEEEIKVEDIPF